MWKLGGWRNWLPKADRRQGHALLGDGLALERLGSATVRHRSLAGPGFWLLEVAMPDGALRTAQFSLCRFGEDLEAARVRLRWEQAVVRYTEAAMAAIPPSIESFGTVAPGPGTLGYYWIWSAAAEPVRAPSPLRSTADFVALSHSLLDAIESAHQDGRALPQLSESMILPTPQGARVLGVPLVPPADALGAPMSRPRLAPHERPDGTARPSGDYWRLGTALAKISDAVRTLDPAWVDTVRTLCADLGADPRFSPADIRAALARVTEHAELDPAEAAMVVGRMASTTRATAENPVTSPTLVPSEPGTGGGGGLSLDVDVADSPIRTVVEVPLGAGES